LQLGYKQKNCLPFSHYFFLKPALSVEFIISTSEASSQILKFELATMVSSQSRDRQALTSDPAHHKTAGKHWAPKK